MEGKFRRTTPCRWPRNRRGRPNTPAGGRVAPARGEAAVNANDSCRLAEGPKSLNSKRSIRERHILWGEEEEAPGPPICPPLEERIAHAFDGLDII